MTECETYPSFLPRLKETMYPGSENSFDLKSQIEICFYGLWTLTFGSNSWSMHFLACTLNLRFEGKSCSRVIRLQSLAFLFWFSGFVFLNKCVTSNIFPSGSNVEAHLLSYVIEVSFSTAENYFQLSVTHRKANWTTRQTSQMRKQERDQNIFTAYTLTITLNCHERKENCKEKITSQSGVFILLRSLKFDDSTLLANRRQQTTKALLDFN